VRGRTIDSSTDKRAEKNGEERRGEERRLVRKKIA
jgi:hypothetical protein